MPQTWSSASSALFEPASPELSDRTVIVWARVLLVGGGAILRGALPVHLPEFQVMAIEGLPTNTRSFLRSAAPDVVLVGLPLDADGRLLLNELGSDAPIVALATSDGDAAAFAMLDQEFAEVIVLDDGELPNDLSARLLSCVRVHRAGASPARAAATAASTATTTSSSTTGERRATRIAAPPHPAEEAASRPSGELEQRLAASLRSLEDAHRQLQERALSLERIVAAGGLLRAAATREELAQAALDVLSGLPGFGLVAVGLQDEARGATEMMGVARLPNGIAIPLGRRTVMLDLLELAPDRRMVSQSQVIEGCCIRIHGSPDTWGPRTARGEWDLSELFDGLAVAVTPLRAAGRSHGFLFVKVPGPGVVLDAESLRAVEILAHLVGTSFDNLRLQESERRRTELQARVNRLSRSLIDLQEPESVLRAACDTLSSVLTGATVSHEQVRGGESGASCMAVLRTGADDPPYALGAPLVAAQLTVPVRVAGHVRARISATSPHGNAFDDLDRGALDLFAEIVGKALGNAQAIVEERRSLLRLQLVSEIGRIASSSLETDEVLARVLGHLCQQGAYEHASVSLVDRERRKLVVTAQASRSGGRPVHGISMHLEQGITGHVAATGTPLMVDDVSRDPRYVAADDAVRSELCVPLRVADDVVGVLNLESRQLAAFDEQDLVAMAAVGDHVAGALANSKLFRQLRDKNRQLRESERNKSEFLAIVAHDLRTPLTSIRSAADVLLMYGEEPPEVKQEFLEGIRDEAARLGRLVDDFLTYSRMEEGVIEYDVQEFDLSEVILHFLRVFEGPAAQRRIELTCHLPASLPPVLADRERVSQVLANLMSNATRYVPEGGHVRIGATVIPGPEGSMMGTVQVDVTDDGPGVEEHDRERIFDKFVRLDGAKGGGAGLGLPIARAIVEHLGGRLRLDGEHRPGARFVFTLPARVGLGM